MLHFFKRTMILLMTTNDLLDYYMLPLPLHALLFFLRPGVGLILMLHITLFNSELLLTLRS